MPDFISVDAGGKLTRIDLDTTADAAPKGAIEVSRDLVMAFSASEQTHHYDVASGTLVADAPASNALPILRVSLCAEIDNQAQAQRDLYVTPGGAQSATYLLKQTQAAQALTAQASNTSANMTAAALAALYPYLANEIGVTVDPSTKATATDVYGVARAVQAVLQAWQPINLAIERMRLMTKAAIAAAATVAAAQAAHDAVLWPTAPTL